MTDEHGFDDLGLDKRLLRTVREVGYETPSPIQAATIPALLAGRHVLGLAQTGTGKTAAFALPILQRLDPKAKGVQALVLAPTRELALQVAEAFERYAAHLPGLHVLAVYGGQGYGVQLSALRRGVHVVVGTPGRIIDHLGRGTLDLSRLRFLVLDEADEMLTMGFADDVETILSGTPDDKQVALFSATMPAGIRRLAEHYLTDAAEINVRTRTATAAATRQRYIEVTYQRKLDALTRLLEVENFEAMIVFVRTKQETETLAERLRARGLSAAAINGDVAQVQRERTINQLRDGRLDILVATDVAARGLDVERISHVVNYDIPTDTEAYVHRIGRTGRAGRSGEAITFVTPRERHQLRAIERATRQSMTRVAVPSVADINQTRESRFAEALTAAMSNDRLDDFRGLLARFERDNDVSAADIAAALAVLIHEQQPQLLPLADDDEIPDPGPAPTSPGRERRGSVERAPYTIAVGRRHRVEPRQIVGALANEGGLSREDFGRIDIRGDHSVVELPARLPAEVWKALKSTRISGKLIELAPSTARKPRRREAR